MTHFRNILVLQHRCYANTLAVARATDLARAVSGHVTLLTVLDESTNPSSEDELDRLEDVAAQQCQRLEFLISPHYLWGVEVTSTLAIGDTVTETVRKIVENRNDLVLVASRQQGTLHNRFNRFAKSIEVELMRRCPCPVWIVSTGPRRLRRVLAALAFDTLRRPDSINLDDAVLRTSMAIARIEEAELHIVHVWRLDGESTFRHRLSLPEEDIERLLASAGRQRLDDFLQYLSPFSLHQVKHDVHFIEGDPEDTIPQVAAKKQADLIVMGTLGRRGLFGIVFGNMSEALLDHVDCSIMTVKTSRISSMEE